jgi:hypothetical protein
MEMKLLDSPLPEPEIKQPKKEVIRHMVFFSFMILETFNLLKRTDSIFVSYLSLSREHPGYI